MKQYTHPTQATVPSQVPSYPSKQLFKLEDQVHELQEQLARCERMIRRLQGEVSQLSLKK